MALRSWRDFRGLERSFVLLSLAGLAPLIGALFLLGHLPEMAKSLQSAGLLGFAAFSVMATFGSALALLPTFALAIASGWTFGVNIGVMLSILSFAAGAGVCSLIVKRIDHRSFHDWISKHRTLDEIRRNSLAATTWTGFWLLCLCRVPPQLPFAIVNVATTLAGVATGRLIAATILGLFPRTYVAAWLGSEASQLSSLGETPAWLDLVGILILGLVVVIMSWIGTAAWKRATLRPHQMTGE